MFVYAVYQRLLAGLLLGLLLVVAANAHAEAVDFTLPDLEDKAHKLSDYRGKWVIVNYWATWCPPCLSEIPELVDFHEQHQNRDAVVLGIDFETIDNDTLKLFVEDYFINYPILHEQPGRLSVMGDIPGLPTTFIVSPEGNIVARQVGRITADRLNSFISRQKRERFQPGVGR